MRIRSKASGTLAEVSDDAAVALIESGIWEPAEAETPKRRPARSTSAKAKEKVSQQ